MQKSALQRLRLVLWIAVGLAGLGAGALYLRMPAPQPVTLEPQALLDVSFALTAHDGRPARQADFRQKPSAWFFGFTHCPDVCPTALMQMTDHLGKLGADGDRLNVVFVTVDPERDTQPVLKDYLSAFDPRITGLTGPPAEIERLAKGYFVYFKKVPLTDGGYTMDHTALVLLSDRAGRFVGTLDPHEPSEVALAKLRRLVAAQ